MITESVGFEQPRLTRARTRESNFTRHSNMPSTTATDAEETRCDLSIRQLISTHPRERLFVQPLFWTARHLELLHCKFFDGGIIAATSTQQEQPPKIAAPSIQEILYPGLSSVLPDLPHKNSDINAARLATARDTISRETAVALLVVGVTRRR